MILILLSTNIFRYFQFATVWKKIHSIERGPYSSFSIALSIDNIILTDFREIATVFGQYFANQFSDLILST